MVPRVPRTEHTTQLLDGEHFSSPLPSTPFSSHFPIARFLLVRGGPWGWSLCSFIPLCWGRFTYQAVSLGPLAGHHFVSTPGKQQIGRRTTWGPAKGAEAKGPHGVLAAKGAEPERALQGLLTRVRTFPGQQLLREQPWILKISSSCERRSPDSLWAA